jgi:outer membrane biosynthesis protein TonB
MQLSLIISLGLHALIILVAYFGIPLLPDREIVVEAPIVVEIINIDDMSNVPAPAPKAKDKPEPEKPEPPKEKPKPPPPAPVKPAPEPEAEPEPAPEPKAEPIPEKKVEKKPEPKPEVVKPKPRLETVKLSKKPQPPKVEPDFTSLMKNLDLKTSPKAEKKKEDQPKLDDFAKDIAAAIKKPSQNSDPSRPMSITEIDALRQHIAKCWNPPIGAKDAENLKIEIEVTMNPDATPRAASIGSRSNLSDPFYRAAAESALRAVNNRRCWPYPLSPETYDQWQDLRLVFDPKELLGL